MTTHIVCPSGLAGEIRGLKGKEGKLLSDRTAARAGATFEKILAGCWVATTDPGIYDLPDGGAMDWSKVLVADRFYTLLQIRAQTFGDEYAFSVQCQSPACRERFEWTLNLQELRVVPLSDAAKAAFKAGNRFETTLPRDGRKICFRLMTGADEVRAASVLRAGRDGMLLTALALRICEIEHVPDHDRRKFLDELDMADAAALLDQFDQADAGVETTIEIECPACLGVQDVELPFERSFFLPDGQDRWEGGEGAVDGLFPAIGEDELWEGIFQLLYRQHGGSGLSLSLEDVMELDLDRIRWLLERLGEQRDKEARELAAAARRGRR